MCSLAGGLRSGAGYVSLCGSVWKGRWKQPAWCCSPPRPSRANYSRAMRRGRGSTGSAMHADVPNREAGSAISAVYLNLLGHGAGWPSPEGGAGSLAVALVGYLRSLGGEIHGGTAVARVIVEQGRVRGVVTATDEEHRARIVIADTSPTALVRLAGTHLPDAYTAKVKRFRPGAQSFKVDWALRGPIPWEAAEARQAGTVHVGGPSVELEAGIAAQEAGELPARPFLLLGQQSLADPTRAPVGCHTAWAYTHVPPAVDWEREAAGHVERMEAQVERFAPGFRDCVLARAVTTPPGFERANANLVGGDVGGGSYALDQLVFRPVPSAFALPHPRAWPVHRQCEQFSRRGGTWCSRRCRRPRCPHR